MLVDHVLLLKLVEELLCSIVESIWLIHKNFLILPFFMEAITLLDSLLTNRRNLANNLISQI